MSHPALEAYFVADEPHDKEGFITAGSWADRIRAVDRAHYCCLNLMFGGETNTVGGVPYATYLNWHAAYFKPEMVSFDHYSIHVDRSTGNIIVRSDWYDNLECISAFSRDIGRLFWAFAMSVAHRTPSKIYAVPTIDHLRLQVYSNLAYGAQGIQYFTFWTPKTDNSNPNDGAEHYYTGPILPDGKRTQIYDLVKTVNEEIKNLSFVFHGSTVTWVRHVDIDNQAMITPLTSELDSTPNRFLLDPIWEETYHLHGYVEHLTRGSMARSRRLEVIASPFGRKYEGIHLSAESSDLWECLLPGQGVQARRRHSHVQTGTQ
jgi:hypothetical protein